MHFSSLASVAKLQAAVAESVKEGVSTDSEQGRSKNQLTRGGVSPSTALKVLQKGEREAPASSPGDIAGAMRRI